MPYEIIASSRLISPNSEAGIFTAPGRGVSGSRYPVSGNSEGYGGVGVGVGGWGV